MGRGGESCQFGAGRAERSLEMRERVQKRGQGSGRVKGLEERGEEEKGGRSRCEVPTEVVKIVS